MLLNGSLDVLFGDAVLNPQFVEGLGLLILEDQLNLHGICNALGLSPLLQFLLGLKFLLLN